jgi:uncharacterized protein (TIGR02996 family)
MSVYFVYRTHYDKPSFNYVTKFEDATVLDWFRHQWLSMQGDETHWNRARACALFGCSDYALYALFAAIREHSLPQPTTSSELQTQLEQHLPFAKEVLIQPHVIQVLTHDDELEMAYYFFDDEYLNRYRDKAAFLLLEGWRLPEDAGYDRLNPAKSLEVAGNETAAIYHEFLSFYGSNNLRGLGAGSRKIEGIRLPQLAHYLAGEPEYEWNFHLLVLRSQLLIDSLDVPEPEKPFVRALREDPTDGMLWDAYSDWLTERGQPALGLVALRRALHQVCRYPLRQIAVADGLLFSSLESAHQHVENTRRKIQAEKLPDPSKSLIQVSEHVAQLCLHFESWGVTDFYHRWIFFDDLWAAAHPDLAKAIQTYSSRWDVLS